MPLIAALPHHHLLRKSIGLSFGGSSSLGGAGSYGGGFGASAAGSGASAGGGAAAASASASASSYSGGATFGGGLVKTAEAAPVVVAEKVIEPAVEEVFVEEAPKVTHIERTVIPNYVEKKIQVPTYVEKTIRVPTTVEKTIRVPAEPTIVEKTIEGTEEIKVKHVVKPHSVLTKTKVYSAPVVKEV